MTTRSTGYGWNMPSRRALERAGFVLESADEHHAWYALPGGDGLA